MASDRTPYAYQIRVWGNLSADYGESRYVGGGVSSKVSLGKTHPYFQ